MSDLLSEKPPQCLVDVHWRDATAVIHCRGAIDMVTAPVVQQCIAEVDNQEPQAMVVDLTGVDFLASCGLGMLVGAHARVSPRAQFAVVADGPGTSRPITLMGLSEVFAMYATVEAALSAVVGVT